jgi:catechol 2,3-dioxygenase
MTHASSLVSALRSVALTVPDLTLAEEFFTRTWQLQVVARTDSALYFRGAGSDHHLLALHHAPGAAQILHITLRAHSLDALALAAQRTAAAGGHVLSTTAPLNEPGGGHAVTLADPDGRVFRLVYDDEQQEAIDAPDMPMRLAHVVLNSSHVEDTRQFMETALDFSMSDRTRIMAFMRCNNDHHSVALGDTDNNALNHIAFLMPDIDAVMRGGGRMQEAGFPIEWGPGRHGPGDNAFNYFIGPFDVVIEYTAEVEQIDDSYQTGQPSDWTWPPGRVDQWGISPPPSARLKEAQRAVVFAR